MKTVKISIQIPEKEDIISHMDNFSNSEIQLFVNDFEGENYKKNWSLTRKTERYDEYYSLVTSTVYQIDKEGYYHKIFFTENRPENIGYGIDPNTRQAKAFCKICETVIFSTPNLIGIIRNYCSCKENIHND